MTLSMDDTTPRPWILRYEPGRSVYEVRGSDETIMHSEAYYPEAPTIADAALIVRAVNAHEALVAILRAVVQEVEDENAVNGMWSLGKSYDDAKTILDSLE